MTPSTNISLLPLELAPMTDLYKQLHDNTLSDAKLSWTLRLKIALDVARGMHHLHSLTPPLLHRDLRSPNVFLMSLDEGADVIAKVADFGLAQQLTTTSGITDRLATWQWMAPEAFAAVGDVSYDERADVYSFAIVLWELSSRQHPFAEFGEMNVFKLKQAICKGAYSYVSFPFYQKCSHYTKTDNKKKATVITLSLNIPYLLFLTHF